MSLVKKIWPNPLHCFLIPVFFIIHNSIDFYGLIEFKTIRTALLLWLLLPFALFGVLYLLFRNKSNAGLYSSLLLLIYFFAVPFLQAIQRVPVLGEWIKLYIVIGFLFFSLLIFFRLLKQNKLSISARTHFFITLIFSVLIVYDISIFIFTPKKQLQSKNVIKPVDSINLILEKLNSNPKPDIYYFLFDMHGSTNAIQKSFGFNNSSLDENLKNLNFEITKNSTSASNYTPTSMTSVFNMSPLPFTTQKKSTFREMYQARNSVRFNVLIPFLQMKGYKIINASSFPIYETDTSYLQHIGWGHPEELLINQTLFHYLWKTYDWIFVKYFPKSYKSFQQQIYLDDLTTIRSGLIKTNTAIALKDTATAKFVYTHLYIPHTPFKYDSLGTTIPWVNKPLKKDKSDSMFLSQLKYCRKLILELAQTIISKNARQAIIIFQGDHGIRDQAMPQSRSFEVLNAIYLPDKKYIGLNHEFYTPNTFRFILNKYFQQQLPMLNPKHVFITLQ